MSPALRSHLRPTPVAAASALLGVVGVAVGVSLLASIPADPPGDGFAAGLAAAFGLAYVFTSALAVGEAAVLALAARLDPRARPRRLLLTGAAAGGLSVVPELLLRLTEGAAVGSTLYTLRGRLVGPLVSGWFLLAVVGFLATVAGVGSFVLGRRRSGTGG